LADNPSLAHISSFKNILPIYILDDINSEKHKMGGASRWWLHNSLTSLNKSLDNNLSFYKGNPIEIIKGL